MRITNSVLARNATETVRQGMSGLDRAQQQVATGRRLHRPSDDPAATADLLGADRRLSALGQYQRNISAATSRLAAQESALGELDGILSRARELAISQTGDTANAATRGIAATEVEQLAQSAVQLANTRFGAGYLFGGAYTDRAPYPTGGPAHDPAGQNELEVAESQYVRTVSDARSIFLDSGVIDSLQQLAAALASNDTAGLPAATQAVSDAFDQVQVALGETGARVQQLELARSNAESLELGLREYRADLSEIDLEEAVTELLSRQNAMQAALMATSRMLNTTLTDYLR